MFFIVWHFIKAEQKIKYMTCNAYIKDIKEAKAETENNMGNKPVILSNSLLHTNVNDP